MILMKNSPNLEFWVYMVHTKEVLFIDVNFENAVKYAKELIAKEPRILIDIEFKNKN